MNIMILHSYAAINVGNGIGPAPLAQGAFGSSSPPAPSGLLTQANAAGFILDWIFYL